MGRRWLLASTLIFLAALASTLVLRGPVSAASPFFQTAGGIDVEYFPQPSEAGRRLLDALDERVSIRFRDASINDLAGYLRDVTGANVHVDVQELDDFGIDLGEPLLTAQFDSLPLKDGVRLLLESAEIAMLVEQEVLRITSEEAAEDTLFTRVYPVADLVAHGGGYDFNPLIELIENTIETDSWDPVGPGTMQEFEETGVLVMNQTQAVHDQVLKLFRSVRASRYVSYGGGSYNQSPATGFFPASDRRATLPMMAR